MLDVNPASFIENVEACTNINVLIITSNPHLTISFTIPSEFNPSSGSIIFGSYSGNPPDVQFPDNVEFRVAEGCTFTGTCTGVDGTFTDINEFFREAASRRHNNGYAADGSKLQLRRN